jgi:hypothetical protein
MGLDSLFSGAKEMFEKAKDLVEEKTGFDLDKIEETLAHPDQLLNQEKEKGSELFQKATAQLTGEGNAAEPTPNNGKDSEGANKA